MKFRWSLLLTGLIAAGSLQARTYKIGTMIPEGTDYANLLADMAKEIKEKTEKRVKLKYYFGGLAGDEPDVLRKIHVGQLHGGVFTAKTLSDVFGDVRVLEVPFSFDTRKQAGEVLDQLRPYFHQGFAKNSFHELGLYEIGEIYIVTKNKIANVDGMQGQKLWLFEGDKLAEAFTKSLDLVAVPVALPDVLTSLSTGLIEAAYAPALGIIALQWHSKVNYLVEPPFAYHFQGFLLSNRAWGKMKDSDQKIVEEITTKYESKISKVNLEKAEEALAAIKKQGVKVIKWPESDIKKLKTLRGEVLKKLTGEILSKKAVSKVNQKL
jgi:TRAP-type C4-dicarboxylate transport system substrate-binding protein